MMTSGPSPPCKAVLTSRSISSGGWNVTLRSVPLFAFSKGFSMLSLKSA